MLLRFGAISNARHYLGHCGIYGFFLTVYGAEIAATGLATAGRL